MSILNRITEPSQLKSLDKEELTQLAEEIRQIIVETVAANGGHLAPNLGVVELTLALHRFPTPSRQDSLGCRSSKLYP